jgi:hypothetical protein
VSKPKSHTLFHFTSKLPHLKGILKNGILPRYCLEDLRWLGVKTEFVAFPMSCFCDIPLSRIGEHVGFYGSYGLGVTKEWATRNGLNPIIYLAKESLVETQMKLLFKAVRQQTESIESLRKASEAYAHLLAFIKPVSGTMTIKGKSISKDFYQESEWRFLAKTQGAKFLMNKADFADPRERESNQGLVSLNCKLELKPADIKYLFVKSEEDIPKLIRFIQLELGSKHTSAEVDILMSRIMPLSSIEHDL